MKDQDMIYVASKETKCEGPKDGIGHPLIYLKIKGEHITCPYCSKIFKLKK